MQTAAYFSDCRGPVARALEQAERGITIAAERLTDRDIVRTLSQKAAGGVAVEIMLVADESEVENIVLDFEELIDNKGNVYFVPETERGHFKEHPFCVIDAGTVIIGSYHWSEPDGDRVEDVVIVTGAREFAVSYLDTFNQLLARNGYPIQDIPRVDSESIARRLELIRSLALLGEYSDLRKHLAKIDDAQSDDMLQQIIDELEAQKFDQVLPRIEQYISRLRSLVEFRDPAVERLKQELLTLEFLVNALSDEKAEIERQINEFTRRHNQELGELILEYLRLRKRKLRQDVDEETAADEKDEKAAKRREEYREAEEEYEHFRDDYEASATAEPVSALSPNETSQLKGLYKKATLLCHPDRVSDADRQAAHDIFIELQHAYQHNDIEGVRAVLERLQQGRFFADRSAALSETDQLRAAVSSLKHQAAQLRAAIRELVRSETYQTLRSVADWDRYFEEKKSALEAEIEQLMESTEDE